MTNEHDTSARGFGMTENRKLFIHGYKNGLPIGSGYFAVAVSLGIAARDYGFSALQGFFASLFTYASAGQYMAFSLYDAGGALAQLVILTFIINARYILMGFALNQRMPEGTPQGTRMLVCTCITDEIFGITIARPGVPSPYYTFGALIAAVPLWALGTAVGISMGNILPARIVSALSVALFGMFIASIIPEGRKDKAVLAAIFASFGLSYAFSKLPMLSEISQGNRTIILTILICTVFALLFPRVETEDDVPAAVDSTAAGSEDAKGGSYEN